MSENLTKLAASIDERSVEWRPVVGKEENYWVSELGEVWARRRERVRGGIVKQSWQISHPGQAYLSAAVDGASPRVHVLVCEAFHGPRPHGLVTRHLDGNPANNRADNLIWGTPSQNQYDMVAHGNHRAASRDRCIRDHLLIPSNLTANPIARECKTCVYAQSSVRRHPEYDLAAEMDRYYRKLVGELDPRWAPACTREEAA